MHVPWRENEPVFISTIIRIYTEWDYHGCPERQDIFFLVPLVTDAGLRDDGDQLLLQQLVQSSRDGMTMFLPPGVTWGMATATMGHSG